MSRWKEFRYRLEELACLALAAAIPRLSRRACVRLGTILGALAFRLDRRGRRVSLANLECVFGDRFTPAQRTDIARRSYQNFVRTMVDLFWSPRLSRENISRHVTATGWEPLKERMTAEKRGITFLCVHEGNWEWASLLGGFLGLTNMTVAENFKNPRLTAIFSRLREATGQQIIPQESSMMRMLKVAKKGGTTGILIDLNLPPSQATGVIEAFGLKICAPLLHAVLAQRGGSLLVPAFTEPMPDGTVRVKILPIVEYPPEATLVEIAQRCWSAMEPYVIERPELYMWAYKHFRYKPRGTTLNYPFYANESGKFEKLLKEQSAASGR